MKVIEAISKLEEILDVHAEKVTDAGFAAKKSLEAFDKAGEPCELDSPNAVCIYSTIFVGTEGMDADEMLGFFTCFEIKKGEISDVKMASDSLQVSSDLDNLITELNAAEDPGEFIKKRGEEAEAEANAALAEMEKEIKKIELVGKIAVGCLFGIIAILGIIIAIL